MPLVTTQELIDDAQERHVGVGAFNVVTLEHAEAIVAGAEAAGFPVILQFSENAVKFHLGQLAPIAGAAATIATAATVAVSLHLDHVENTALMHQAPEAGVTSIMFDASRLDFEANVAATRGATDWGHRHLLHMEAELGEVGGKDGAHAPGARTEPRAAAEYVAATGVDALAVAVGSSHAMTTRTARLDHDLISRLRGSVPVPLVLHGSSGVADEELRRAVQAGIVKVNIGTIVNVAFTNAVRETLLEQSVVDPRKYLSRARGEITTVVHRLLTVIGSV